MRTPRGNLESIHSGDVLTAKYLQKMANIAGESVKGIGVIAGSPGIASFPVGSGAGGDTSFWGRIVSSEESEEGSGQWVYKVTELEHGGDDGYGLGSSWEDKTGDELEAYNIYEQLDNGVIGGQHPTPVDDGVIVRVYKDVPTGEYWFDKPAMRRLKMVMETRIDFSTLEFQSKQIYVMVEPCQPNPEGGPVEHDEGSPAAEWWVPWHTGYRCAAASPE